VFLISGDDFTNGFSASPGYFVWDARRSPPIRLRPEVNRSRLDKLMRTVALVRYLRGNLSFSRGALIQLHRGADHAAVAVPACRPGVLSKEDDQLLTAFATELPRALKLPPQRVILVFDADRRRIYAGSPPGASCQSRAMLANQRLAQLAREGGMHVIETQELFRRHFDAGLGPLDRSPLDAHWNPAAHRIAAEAVARIIQP
jgi:hypothetical protein